MHEKRVAETHRNMWGVRSPQNGQLELRRRRREGQKDLHTAVSARTHQAEFCWKTTRTSRQRLRCQNWQYELVSAHIGLALPFVLFFDCKRIVIVVVTFLLPLHQTDPWQNLDELECYLSVYHDRNVTYDWTAICLSTSNNTSDTK